jgi:KDO2-lipid IV(A) lauroyltransferase
MIETLKKTVQAVKDWSAVLGISIVYHGIPLLPLKVSYAFASRLATILGPLLKKRLRTIYGNLEVAFGSHMSDEDKREIVLKMGTDMLKAIFDCAYLASSFRSKADVTATIEGKHHLDEALSRGKGVITFSAHFGSFIILGSFMTRESYPFYMLLNDPDNKPLARLFDKIREATGQQWISTTPFRQCQKKILNCLRKNEIICFIADENKRRGGVEVDFFGHSTPTAVGPAVLSLRTGAALVPLFIVRQRDNTHKIIIEPALECNLSGDLSKDIHALTSAFTKRIEFYIREYPDQWLWTNRRWKGLSRGDKHYQG